MRPSPIRTLHFEAPFARSLRWLRSSRVVVTYCILDYVAETHKGVVMPYCVFYFLFLSQGQRASHRRSLNFTLPLLLPFLFPRLWICFVFLHLLIAKNIVRCCVSIEKQLYLLYPIEAVASLYTGVSKAWSYLSHLFPRRAHIPETQLKVTNRQSTLSEQQKQHLLNSGLVDPAWLHVSDTTGPRASPIPTPQPRFPDTTTHDGEQHQHQVILQQPEEYSQEEPIEEDCVSGVISTSSFAADNVSSLQCKYCRREYQSRGLLKYVFFSCRYFSILPTLFWWSKSTHIKTHTRPFKCTMDACTSEFATAKDLMRHKQTVHKASGCIMAYCHYPSCDYSANGRKGPMRQDNLQRHIGAKHRLEAGF